MTSPKPVFLVAGGVLLFVVLTQIIPWPAVIMIAILGLIVLAFFGHLGQQVTADRSAAIPRYQPPAQQKASKPEPPPRANPPLNFDLTTQEYQQLSKQYQQGLSPQVQKPTGAGSWSPFSGFTPASNQAPQTNGSQPKQEHPSNYEQPQAEYPQKMPPMA